MHNNSEVIIKRKCRQVVKTKAGFLPGLEHMLQKTIEGVYREEMETDLPKAPHLSSRAWSQSTQKNKRTKTNNSCFKS